MPYPFVPVCLYLILFYSCISLCVFYYKWISAFCVLLVILLDASTTHKIYSLKEIIHVLFIVLVCSIISFPYLSSLCKIKNIYIIYICTYVYIYVYKTYVPKNKNKKKKRRKFIRNPFPSFEFFCIIYRFPQYFLIGCVFTYISPFECETFYGFGISKYPSNIYKMGRFIYYYFCTEQKQ